MEHKDLWLVMGLTIILAVAVSISTASITGDAVFGRITATKTPQLTCKIINSEIISNTACKNALGRDYNCVSATLIARVTSNEASSLFTMPMECDTAYSDKYADDILLENLKGGKTEPTWANDKDVAVTCCKII